MDTTFTDVGLRISKRIRELGLKQLDVCNKSGLSTTALSQYCTGKRIPDTLSLYKLSIILGVSMEWVLTGDNLTSEKQAPEPLGLDEIKAAQGLTCDGLPLSEDEVDLVAMYRLLPPSHREELFDLAYFKYKRVVEQKKESIYSTYFDGSEDEKSSPAGSREARDGTA
ncbi:helix-turn-helix domain-containing protein [Intestinimonas sp. HCP28S3_D6]|uniref:helix-turn-helix domain-containing protein n=1 Tax=Intestinimonas sp. HCP28S3_D6 TaxID=3438942 RepID=UPI003F8A33DE